MIEDSAPAAVQTAEAATKEKHAHIITPLVGHGTLILQIHFPSERVQIRLAAGAIVQIPLTLLPQPRF